MESVNGHTPETVQLKRTELWKQLANAVALISKQDQILWAIFSVFWGANALLLVALFDGGKWPAGSVGAFISLFGFLMSAVWHEMLIRGIGHLDRFENLAEILERALAINPAFAISGKINRENYLACLGNKPGFGRRLMKACSVGGIVVWLSLFAIFGYGLILATSCR